MHTARDELDGMLNMIRARTHVCIRCQTQLRHMTIVTADVDQAFEMCDASRVMPAFTYYMRKFQDVFG
eukprot:2052458-Amphidinium_carterae.1